MAQDALNAAHADAVPLSQFSLWCTGTTVTPQLADDFVAQPVDDPPMACPNGGCGAPVVNAQTADHLGSICHYVPIVGVRTNDPLGPLRDM